MGKPGPERTDELELVDAALRGDIDAFANLFERYRPALYALCLKQLGDPSLAEDIVQEVFIKAFRNLSKFDRTKSFWPWLGTMAFRMCIDLQRRRSFTHYSGDIGSLVDTDESNGTSEQEAASALDAVIVSEERAEVWESLEVLTNRQRRAFVLYALDGWSCADIAAAEGISVGAVKLLLFRARRKMRAERQSGLPMLVALPFTWLRSRLQEAEEQIRLTFGVFGERLSGAGTLAVPLGMLAIIAIIGGGTAAPTQDRHELPSDAAIVLAQTETKLASEGSFYVLSPGRIAAKPEQTVSGVSEPEASFAESLINPEEHATPEDSTFNSIMVSPSYEKDHTILAFGSYRMNSVMFFSNDGGANWAPRVPVVSLASNFWAVDITSGYPNDQRIFGIAEIGGLLQSDDGGEIFRPVSPLTAWSFAISPSFGRADSKVLMGAKTVLEYDAGTGVTRPSLLNIPSAEGFYNSIVFSPGYASDQTVFVSDSAFSSRHYRCQGAICDQIQHPFHTGFSWRLSPRFDQDGLGYAFTNRQISVYNDADRSFRNLNFLGGGVRDVAILWNALPNPVIFVNTTNRVAYRSFDSGFSWSRGGLIWVPAFDWGNVTRMVVTPTGRLLGIGYLHGLACSEDMGKTWAPRCTPEK